MRLRICRGQHEQHPPAMAASAGRAVSQSPACPSIHPVSHTSSLPRLVLTALVRSHSQARIPQARLAMMLLQPLMLSMLVAVSGLVMPSAAGACAARCVALSSWAPSRVARVCMADEVSDFTEDLLDALTAEEAPVMDMPAEFYKAGEGAQLEPLLAYTNMKSVEGIRAKYMKHEQDTGSAQVQVAVLTARIAYMTKHMEQNRKDYASLRGLTAMVTRRRKLLEFLLRDDATEFYRLTSELGIRTRELLKPKLTGARGRRAEGVAI